MKFYRLPTLFVCLSLALASCATDETHEENTADEKIENAPDENGLIPDNVDEQTEDTEESVWAIYEGKLGLYQQQIVMELLITGDKITGNYFYAKHQKTIELSGSFDPGTQLAKVTESYKGKATGYLEFYLEKGELSGHWMKKAGARDKEDFTARLVSLSKNEYLPKHARYESVHEVVFYADEENLRDEVADELKMTQLGSGYYAFHYSITGDNGHTGMVEGLAHSIGGRTFFEDEQGCRLNFEFGKNKVTISEEEDCSYYRGARAYFGGTLTKKN